MKIVRLGVDRSPLDPAKVRLSGHLSIRPGPGDIEVWFDVDEELADKLATSGAPWLLAMIPYALEFGGTIEIDRPTDALLVENLTMLGRMFRKWYPDLKPYDIQTDHQILSTGAQMRMSFFSGGIDGAHTALRHSQLSGSEQVGTVDELLMVWGFDIELDTPEEFSALYNHMKPFVQKMGVPLRTTATNIRRPGTFWRRRWGPLCHTIGRAACAYAVEGHYKSAIWGSNFLAEDAEPSGSHPWTDQYFSSTSLTAGVDGSAHSRMDKVVFLARYPWTLEDVHVCFRDARSGNCGKCTKCIRSGVAIDLVGFADRCRSLSLPVPAKRIEQVYCDSPSERVFFNEMLQYARKIGRRDIERSVSKALRRSSRIRPLMDFAERCNNRTGMYWVARTIRSSLGTNNSSL